MALRHGSLSPSSVEMEVMPDREGQAGNSNGMSEGVCESICWGCGLCLTLPSYSPIFKCGYCGCINEETSPDEEPKKRPGKPARFYIIRDRLMTAAVSILILSLICFGVWFTYPLVCSRGMPLFINILLTTFFSLNTLFNFIMCSIANAGTPRPLPWGSVDKVARDSLQDCTFCATCQLPKPIGAHHCRACKHCVHDMDHHCPFIGNCVGARNQRHFVVFLVYATSSCIYVSYMASTAFARLWPTFQDSKDGASVGHSISSLGLGPIAVAAVRAILHAQMTVAIKAMALAYLTIVGISTFVGLGILLSQQLHFICEGRGYIDSLKAPGRTHPGGLLAALRHGHFAKDAVKNCRQVFGNESVVFWLMPRLTHPPGSHAEELFGKSHKLT